MDDIFEDYFDEGDALSQVDTGTGKQLSDLVHQVRKSKIKSRTEQYLKTVEASTSSLPKTFLHLWMRWVWIE